MMQVDVEAQVVGAEKQPGAGEGFASPTAVRPGPEAAKSLDRRVREGFFKKYLSGDAVLDIGYRGGRPDATPVTEKAIGVELDYPGYDGTRLPFPDNSQDAVFVSHCLEHIDDYQSVLADWYRVLRVGGYLIIAVPHQQLYERKPTIPSRFNGDHRRFYTPASLLGEIERSLPVGGHRVRTLRDIDDGFDYCRAPEFHSAGCYEIELVIEKIRIPEYASRLVLSPPAKSLLTFFAGVAIDAIDAARRSDAISVGEFQNILGRLPLPPFSLLLAEIRGYEKVTGRPRDLRIDELKTLLKPLVAQAAFDEKGYLITYKDIAAAVDSGRQTSGRGHFVAAGYFEGRYGGAHDPLFG